MGQNAASAGVRKRNGAATVELALVAPVILFMLFSIIEMGFMVKNRAELGQAAREAARLGAVGATPSRMNQGIASSLSTIDYDGLTITYEYRPWDEDSQTWGSWTALGVDGSQNNAAKGGQIRVELSFNHSLLVPGVMSGVLNANENDQVNLAAASVMMRE